MVVRKMKEKCKDAARMRREKERAEFVELSKLLPLPSSTTSQLDKASIIRLTSSYLRMRSAFPEGLGENWGYDLAQRLSRAPANLLELPLGGGHQNRKQQPVRELGSLILQTLDGFVFALHKDGKIMYISETASVHLGLPQIDLTGSSIFEYVHGSDHNDINDTLTLSELDKAALCRLRQTGSGQETFELARSFCIRMKCILPKRNAGLVSSGHKAIHCNGYLKVRCNNRSFEPTTTNHHHLITTTSELIEWEPFALVAVGHSLLPSASTEVKLNASSFMFRASLDLKLHYVESSVSKLLGFEQTEMVGQSLYQFLHVEDSLSIENSHKVLLDKGQMVTKYYRLMRKEGGFVWVQSLASLVSNPKNLPKPQHVVATCFVLATNELDKSCITSPSTTFSLNLLEKSIQANKADLLKSILPVNTLTIKQKKQLQRDQDEPEEEAEGEEEKQQQKRKREKLSKPTKPLQQQSYNNNNYQDHQLQIRTTTTNPLEQTSNNNLYQHSPPFLQQSHYQCHCCQGLSPAAATFTENPAASFRHSIGPTRRASDDSCSVVSSIASTSFSSNSSNSISSTSTGYQTDNYASKSYFSALEPAASLQHQLMTPTESTSSTGSSKDESILVEIEPIVFPLEACNSLPNYQTNPDLWFASTNNNYQQYSLAMPTTAPTPVNYHHYNNEEQLANNYSNLTMNHYHQSFATNHHYHPHQMAINNDFTISTV